MEKRLEKLYPLFQKFSEQYQQAQQTVSAILSIIPHIEAEATKNQSDDLPQYFSVQQVVDYLGIHTSNFYRNVHNKLLYPALRVGRRSYYLQSDVKKLFTTHETGAHTYSKKQKPE